MAPAAFPDALGQSSSGEETFLYLEELDLLLQELQSRNAGEAARDSWGLRAPGLAALQRGCSARGVPCAPLLPPASCPQVPSGGGRSGSYLAGLRSRVDRGKGHRKVPGAPLAPASDASRQGCGERVRDLERYCARPQLSEPPLAPRGGRWAGMARGDTYIGAGGGGVGTHEGWGWEGASAQGNPTPGAGLQGEGKAEASRACWTWAGDGAQLGKPSGAQGTRGARTPQLRGPRRTAAPAALEDPRLHCGRQLRSPGGPEGLRLQSAGSTRLAWPGWQAEGSPGV